MGKSYKYKPEDIRKPKSSNKKKVKENNSNWSKSKKKIKEYFMEIDDDSLIDNIENLDKYE